MAKLIWVPRRSVIFLDLSKVLPTEIVVGPTVGHVMFVQPQDADQQIHLRYLRATEAHFAESKDFVGTTSLPGQPERTVVVKHLEVRYKAVRIWSAKRNCEVYDFKNIPGEGIIEVSLGVFRTRAAEDLTIKYRVEQ